MDFGPGNICRASFTLVCPGGLEIKDCMLKEGQQFGWFVEGPSAPCKPWTDDKGKEHTYKRYLYIPNEMKDAVLKLAQQEYDPQGTVSGTTQASAQGTPESMFEADEAPF